MEKGSTIVVSKTGDEVEALYTAVHVKKDDQWKISQLVETPMPEIAPVTAWRNSAWLIGDWEEADKDSGRHRPQPLSMGARRQFHHPQRHRETRR